MLLLCYFQECDKKDPDKVNEEGLVLYDYNREIILDHFHFDGDEEHEKWKLFTTREDCIEIDDNHEKELDNPDFDEDSEEDDDNPRYIYKKQVTTVWPFYQNALCTLPITNSMAYSICRLNKYPPYESDKNYQSLYRQLKGKSEAYSASLKKSVANRFDALIDDALARPTAFMQAAPRQETMAQVRMDEDRVEPTWTFRRELPDGIPADTQPSMPTVELDDEF